MKFFLLSIVLFIISSVSPVSAERKDVSLQDKLLGMEEQTNSPVPVSAFVLLDARDDISRDVFYAYWRDVHGILAARYDMAGRNYFQHHLDIADQQIWPNTQSVQTVPEVADHIEGVAVATFGYTSKEADQAVKERNMKISSLVLQDEQNIFKGTYSFFSIDKNSILMKSSERGEGLYTVIVLLRKIEKIKLLSFQSYLRDELAPALAADDRSEKVVLNFLEDHTLTAYSSPGVDNILPVDKRYDAVLEMGFETAEAATNLFNAEPIKKIISKQQLFLKAAFAYPVRATYTMAYNGRPTQIGLRGYPATKAINSVCADNQKQLELLQVIYGADTKIPVQ